MVDVALPISAGPEGFGDGRLIGGRGLGVTWVLVTNGRLSVCTGMTDIGILSKVPSMTSLSVGI